ncbi:MAG: 4Fe-4S binding protein [Oscillospiraceae bacterium]|jgi:ferredoxin|nr:4Fe-4S binding protein [Oscillospiraceae bacterium]
MKRKIIKINEDLCNGCGLCADACHEGAIGMVNGKAKLLRDDYCDGLGDCLPVCPTGAITFEEREAAAYDEEAVQRGMAEKIANTPLPCGCPGTNAKSIERKHAPAVHVTPAVASSVSADAPESMLNQWPVQIKLVPPNAPYFRNAHLLVAADCTAFAYGNFHSEFMRNKITLIGCPKLDAGDYSEKLTAILKENPIKSVTVARMEVPCCGGLSDAAVRALQNCGKMIPWQVVTISTDGRILEQ